MIWLKQSTARTLLVGPFLDEDDGKSAEGGLTITQADVRLSKNGGNMAQKTEATALVHDELGMYTCLLDTTDTGTLGILTLNIHESGALPVFMDFMVVPANVWESMFGADKLQVDAVEIEGTDATDQINAACDTAVADYDGPTKGEMDTGHGLLATEAKQDVIDGIVDAIVADTAEVQAALADGGFTDLLIDAIKAKTDNLPGSPAAVGSAMTLANDAITSAKFDESSAYPLKSADTGASEVARTGADSDTLETLSDQLDGVSPSGIADGVWDEAAADHVGAGSMGKALADLVPGSPVNLEIGGAVWTVED